MSSIKQLWVEKYRSKTLDEYVFQNKEQKSILERIVKTKDIPHLLLTGQAGSGKTTISKLLISLLKVDEMDVLTINASENNGVDYIRDVISNFASTYPMGDFKIIHLEEADYLSPAAQGILRVIMEQASDTCRFIATCNFDHKIIGPLKSRFQHLVFKSMPKDDVMVRIGEILVQENIEFDIDLLEKFVDSAYPDIRKIINNLQLSSIDGKLLNPIKSETADYKFKLLDLIENKSFKELRKLLTEEVSYEEYDDLYRFLYQNIHKLSLVSKDISIEAQALIILNDAQYKHKIVAVPELNLDTCLIKLQELLTT